MNVASHPTLVQSFGLVLILAEDYMSDEKVVKSVSGKIVCDLRPRNIAKILMKSAPLNTVNHHRKKETIANVRTKYGLLICTTNEKLQNSQVQYANPHGHLHYNNLQDKLQTITPSYSRQCSSLS